MKAAIVLAALVTSANLCFSAAISIPNYSFEADTGYGGVWGGPPSNWNRGENLGGNSGASTVLQVVAGTTFAGKNGSNYLTMNVDGGQTVVNVTSTNSIWTPSLGTYAADTKYTLTVALATDANYTDTRSAIISLLADGAVVQSNSLLFTQLSNTAFQDYSVVVDTQLLPSVVGKNVSVMVTHSLTNERYGKSMAVDNVRLDASPVPEPGSLAVIGASTLVLMRRQRRC